LHAEGGNFAVGFWASGFRMLVKILVVRMVLASDGMGLFDYALKNSLISCEQPRGQPALGADLPEVIIINHAERVSEDRSARLTAAYFLRARPLASVLFDASEFPDLSPETVDLARSIAWHGLRPMSLLAHYRHGISSLADPSYVHWNAYIPELISAAKRDRQVACSCHGSISPHQCFIDMATSRTSRRALKLGGDGEQRLDIFQAMLDDGSLSTAEWSLSRPDQCNSLRPPPKICLSLPKTLDRPLRGNLEASDKDVSFPPVSLYGRTGYSVVFESQICAGKEKTAFFTEKLFKPLRYGHPFIHDCSYGSPWPVLQSMGFNSYAPIIPTSHHFVACDQTESGLACHLPLHRRAIRDIEERIRSAPASQWREVQEQAGLNAHHFQCRLPSILRDKAKRAWGRLIDNADVQIAPCSKNSPLTQYARGQRLCRRFSDCNRVVPQQSGAPPIVKYAVSAPCGFEFGSDVLEYAALHALAIRTARPLLVIRNEKEPIRMVVESASYADAELVPIGCAGCEQLAAGAHHTKLGCTRVKGGCLPRLEDLGDVDTVRSLPLSVPVLFVSTSLSRSIEHNSNRIPTRSSPDNSERACGICHAFARVSAHALHEASLIARHHHRIIAIHIHKTPNEVVRKRLVVLKQQLGAFDGVFVVADTKNGLAKTILGSRVITRHDDNEPEQLHSVRDATRMVVDFLVVSQADEIICIGSTNVPRLAIAIALSGKQPVVLS
jgi:hypothetical protein